MQIDLPTLVNWIFFYLVIPLAVSVGGTHFTYRNQQKRDDIAWQREKEKALEQFKHEFELLSQQTKQDLDREQERFVRFQIFPAIFSKMSNAITQANHLLHKPVQMSFGSWTDEQVSHFLEGTTLTDAERLAVISSADRGAEFSRLQLAHQIDMAAKAQQELWTYYVANKIWISNELYSLLDQLNDALANALVPGIAALTTGSFDSLPSLLHDLNTAAAKLFPQIQLHIRHQPNS